MADHDDHAPTGATVLDQARPAGVPASDGRAARFEEEIARLAATGGTAKREQLLSRLGGALLVVGPAWVAAAYLISHAADSSLQQRDAMVAALFGVALTLVGVALFLRYAGARFLRFWLARLSYEQQRHTEQVVEALEGRPRP